MPDAAAYLQETKAFFERVNEEDRILVECVQRGVSAPLATPGPLGWLEHSIEAFRDYLLAVYAGHG